MACLAFLVYFTIVLTAVRCVEKEICAQTDISNENDLYFEDLLNKVWYFHISLDSTNQLKFDPKAVFQIDVTGKCLLGYYVGRTKTADCELTLYQNIHTNGNRSCISSIVLLPATVTPPLEWVATMFGDAKSQLLFYTCLDTAKRSDGCDNIVALGATPRPNLLPEEKERFEAKLTDFAGNGHFPPVGLPLQQPTANNCEDPYAKGMDDGVSFLNIDD